VKLDTFVNSALFFFTKGLVLRNTIQWQTTRLSTGSFCSLELRSWAIHYIPSSLWHGHPEGTLRLEASRTFFVTPFPFKAVGLRFATMAVKGVRACPSELSWLGLLRSLVTRVSPLVLFTSWLRSADRDGSLLPQLVSLQAGSHRGMSTVQILYFKFGCWSIFDMLGACWAGKYSWVSGPLCILCFGC
jgi:hypothetical protein